MLRLLNLDNLSGQGQPGKTGGEVFTISLPVGGQILTQPAVWVNPADGGVWVFVSNGSGLAALQFVLDGSGNPSLQSRWTAGCGHIPHHRQRCAVLRPQRADLGAQPRHRKPALVEQPGGRHPLAKPGGGQWRAVPGRPGRQPERLFPAVDAPRKTNPEGFNPFRVFSFVHSDIRAKELFYFGKHYFSG